MTVYNVNLGIGWASSGVEFAQKYRNQSLRDAKIDAKFIFSDLILENNIADLTRNMKFKDEEIIWLYNFFTDIKIAPSTYLLSQLERDLDLKKRSKKINNLGKEIVYQLDDTFNVIVRLNDKEKGPIDQVGYRRGAVLVRRDFYSYTKYCSEYYLGTDKNNHVVFREFFNENGSLAYTQYLNSGQEIFEFADGKILYSKDELYLAMLKQLNFTKQDVIILDREDEDENLINGQLIFENHGPAKLIVVVHAEHFDKHYTNEHHILWNNFYEYQFSHASEVDSFVVATNNQKEILAKQFKKYYHIQPRIDCIPVGNLPKLIYPTDKRKPFSLITASRLAKEKHIDWLIKAVVAAKNQIPELSLDIYGKGSEVAMLQNLINANNAQDYIHLMGQYDLTNIYSKYSAYIAGSTSEGFGLSLLEAIGSGLAMIGFDVPYGNPTFIENNENGYLIPYDENWNEFKKEELLTKAIIKLFKESDLESFSKKSYQIAKPYLTKNITKKWEQVLGELVHD
ncbi:accessory Sec system glycosyltransferase GtfA [Lactobacillus agrestimuris]|uniref:accessory Sec system glycosyltransferase GtfA n=1 Tax=Lactobacillus agrestimuris TaxID=2941328 RepID=UPI00204387B8|nr:accessory Sec system glycosyltransferase GtfA [Lactobacillus agrestimuris]